MTAKPGSDLGRPEPEEVRRPLDATLSVTRAARLLGVHPNTVRAWSEQGRLRYYRINARGDRRYRVGDLQTFLAEAERGSMIGAAGRTPGARHALVPQGRFQPSPLPPNVLAPRSRAAHSSGAAGARDVTSTLSGPDGINLPGIALGQASGAGADGHGSAARRSVRSHPSAAPRSGAHPAAAAPRPIRHSAVAHLRAPGIVDRSARTAGMSSAAASTGPIGLRQLTDLAELMSAGRSLDAILHASARLVRDATRAADVAIWELRDDAFLRRAASSAAGPQRHVPASAPPVVPQAVTQRRPVMVPLGPAGARGRASSTAPLGLDIAVPIVIDDPWGALSVRLHDLRPGDDTVGWLEAAAALLGAAVRSGALLDEAAREVHRGEALRRVAMDTSGTLDLDETLSRVVDHAMVLFGADRGAVFVRDAHDRMSAGASRGLSAAYLAAVRHLPDPSLPADASRERRPLFALNYRDDPRSRGFRAAVVQEGFDTICAAPLLDGEETIGLLNLYHDRPKDWTPAELETMAAFASQITVAVRSAQQYTQLARWAAQLQSIQQLGARLNRLTTVPEIADAIARELRVLIECDNIRVYRLDGDELNAVALHATDPAYFDETPELVQRRIGQGITGWVAAHGIAQNLPNSTIDPRARAVARADQFDESMLVAPFIFEDRVLGVVALARRGLDQFTDDDLRLLEIYAGIAAQAIANADATERLERQSAALQRQLRSQRELLEITESILSTLDPRAVMSRVADRLGRLVRYDTLSIDLNDRHTGVLTPLTARGPDGEARLHPTSDDGLADWVIRHNEARLVAGTSTDGDAPSRIVVPLRGREGVTGVLTLSRGIGAEVFTGDEFELVQLFAAQVSIALHNAETHRAVELRARTDDLTGLLNHGSLREWLAQSAIDGSTFSLIMLDLDEFKGINDTFGHQAGDRLLSEIGAAIAATSRDGDLVFRYGGDEFAVLLPGTDAAGAMLLAERIRGAVRAVGPRGGHRELQITASIGVATFPIDGATATDMLLAADRACFVAKRSGRDRIADAARGLSLAAEFSLQEPTPVDSSDPHWADPASSPDDVTTTTERPADQDPSPA